jgi:hypothetical protein
MPGNLVSPTWCDIFKGAVLIGIVLEEPIVIVIRDSALASSFRSYFDMMWRISED